MKRWLRPIYISIMAGVFIFASTPAHAIDAPSLLTGPTQPIKTDGPFLITGYSFQGHTLRYVQIANISASPQTVDGWSLVTAWAEGTWTYPSVMSGTVAPGKKIIIANQSAVDGATFSFQASDAQPVDTKMMAINLVPPSMANWNNATVSVSVTGSTPSILSSPPTYFFNRNTSTTTGAYLSTFTAFIPDALFHLEVDPLYARPLTTNLKIVELYSKAQTCGPNDVNSLCSEYVKLYNTGDEPLLLREFRLRSGSYGQSATSSNTARLPELILPSHSFVSFPLGLVDSGAWAWIEDEYGVAAYDETIVNYPSVTGHDGMAWSLNNQTGQFQWTRFPTPGSEANKFNETGIVNQCSALKLSEIAANYSSQFIEVYNASGLPIDISGCQLQTNRSQAVSYVFSKNSILNAGSYAAISVANSGLALTKTTSGTVYLLNSDGSVEVDSRSYENLDENSSLALVGGRWLQTFRVTPGSDNIYEQYLPCETGYIRNEATGRCNKIEVAEPLKPCADAQYRSEETGRCRNLATLTSSLAPCADNQFRSPETNRCRLLTSTTDELKPCAANQERNAETNRCRNVASTTIPAAGFAIKKTTDATNTALGWWAFAGVGSLILGYGGWEWRYEIGKFFRKLVGLVAKT